MNFYENLIILDPKLDSKAAEEAVERIKDVVTKKGGEVLKTENWGRKKLAYELKKRKEGIYVLLLFKAPSQAIVELERFYKVFEPLFKFLVIKLKKKQIEAVLPAAPEAG
ncbi:MAG: 30S ribosomal protein S6, partial [Nitrospirota bacterium]